MKKRLCLILSLQTTITLYATHVSAQITDVKSPAVIKIDLLNEKQKIHSFGASDSWSAKFIGSWTNQTKKDQIADYLFSTETDNHGNPKGIGLSLWRFNIGAGSFEQGNNSDIPNEYRREECFLDNNGNYNWQKHTGQQWFMNAAQKRGVSIFLGYAVSPPVQFTINQKAIGLGNNKLNLQPNKYDAFADFLVRVCAHFQNTKTPLTYLSPFNEPQWNWGSKPSQEGTGATNAEMAKLIKILGTQLHEGTVATKIVFGEANQWNSLYTNNKSDRGEQIQQFFDPSSGNYIGNVPNVYRTLSAHSYFTTCPDDSLLSYRRNANTQRIKTDPKLNLWMTEFGVLGDICGKLKGGPRHTGIDYGLYVAKVIHHDLTVANVTSWQWWLAINPYNYSDGLVYINDTDGKFDLQRMKTDGIVSGSKQLWCMGNFSRFVRPGMVRVGANIDEITEQQAASTQMVSAYKDTVKKNFVVVIVNMEDSPKRYRLQLNNGVNATGELITYTTAASKDLQKSIAPYPDFMIEAKSVTTICGAYR